MPPPDAKFHGFDDYERLIEAARKTDPRAHLAILLGGNAGLRCGEMMALEWKDVDLARRRIHIRRSDWKGNVTLPKGGRARFVPLTLRLTRALQAHRHLRGRTVLCREDGGPLTQKIVRELVRKAAENADLEQQGVHILRHTFCSHLAMRGAPAIAIQELAGHKDLSTTQQYMHLSPPALETAIRLLDQHGPFAQSGDILETGTEPTPKVGV